MIYIKNNVLKNLIFQKFYLKFQFYEKCKFLKNLIFFNLI